MKYCCFAIFSITLLLATAAGSATSPQGEDFEHGVSKAWTAEGLGPQPDSGTVEDDQESSGNHFLRISTDGSFYSIGIESPFDPIEYPILSWRWRVDRMPTHADIASRGGDDAAARLYVIFQDGASGDHKTLRKLEYVWDTSHAVGSIIPDPYSPDTVKAIVLETGNAKLVQWVREQTNLVSDYQRAFGTRPGRVKTIAFASDSNETHSASTSDFDDLQISAVPPPSAVDKSKP